MPDYQSPAEVYQELAGLCDQFAGISHARIDEQGGLQWPCPDPEHPGTPTLHGSGPIKGKAPFQATVYRPSEELPDDEYPLLLSTGRTLYHYNAATQTRRSSGANMRQPENFIEMHRKDARKRGFVDGQLVRVISRRGAVLARVNVSPRMRIGCVWMPLHFGEANTNYLTNDAGDPVTQTAEYKVCAVRVEAIAAGAESAAE
ncbi:MAG: molybdopterin oxidoreductase family protein [Enhygromyxa sp.]